MSKTFTMQTPIRVTQKRFHVNNGSNTITFKINKKRLQLVARRLALAAFAMVTGIVIYKAFETGNPLFYTLLKAASVLMLVGVVAFFSKQNNPQTEE